MRDVVGIGAHHRFDLPVVEKFGGVVLEVKHDAGAARRRVSPRSTASIVNVPLPSDDQR